MGLSTAECLELVGTPRNAVGELVLIWRLLQRERLLAAPIAPPLPRPALARAA